VQADGGTRITNYAQRNWEEAFAESFASYVTDRETFRLLRPNTFAFFAQRFPLA
jgi:hypothetical protein